MKDIWSLVNESSSYTGSYDALDSAVESVTDQPETMLMVTGECAVQMVAMEAAIAKAEGVAAVETVIARNHGDYAAMEQASAVFEGFLSDAWTKFKNLIKKIWTAIKNFCLKWYKKFKDGLKIIWAKMTSYEKVIKGKNLVGLEVEWLTVDGNKVAQYVKSVNDGVAKNAGEIDKIVSGVTGSSVSKKDADDAKDKIAILMARTGSGNTVGAHTEKSHGEIVKEILNKITGKSVEAIQDAVEKKAFTAVQPSITQLLRDGTAVDQFYKNNIAATDDIPKRLFAAASKVENDLTKKVSNGVDGASGANDDGNAALRGLASAARSAYGRINSVATYKIQQATTLFNQCAGKQRALAVAAMKAAIRWTPDKSSFYATSTESTVSLDSLIGTII